MTPEEIKVYVENLSTSLKKAGIIICALSAERWEQFLTNCRHNCGLLYKIGFVIVVFGAISLLTAYAVTRYKDYLQGCHMVATITSPVGIVFISFGIGMLVSTFVQHIEIRRHNSRRFPPNDEFI